MRLGSLRGWTSNYFPGATTEPQRSSFHNGHLRAQTCLGCLVRRSPDHQHQGSFLWGGPQFRALCPRPPEALQFSDKGTTFTNRTDCSEMQKSTKPWAPHHLGRAASSQNWFLSRGKQCTTLPSWKGLFPGSVCLERACKDLSLF